jgi:hypothetical protein
MTRAQEIRHEVLLQLYGKQAIPSTITSVKRASDRARNDYSEHELRDALFFLVSQGYASKQTNPATGEIEYLVTGAGTLFFENGN